MWPKFWTHLLQLKTRLKMSLSRTTSRTMPRTQFRKLLRSLPLVQTRIWLPRQILLALGDGSAVGWGYEFVSRLFCCHDSGRDFVRVERCLIVIYRLYAALSFLLVNMIILTKRPWSLVLNNLANGNNMSYSSCIFAVCYYKIILTMVIFIALAQCPGECVLLYQCCFRRRFCNH